jgi:hypothetical protein
LILKKIGSIFLSVIFLASALGVSINSHYCGKKLSSVGLVAQGCCCKKKTAMKKDCCKNEIKYVKIADDYSPSAQFHFAKVDIAPIVLNFPFVPAISDNSFSILYNNHSPPPKFADRVIAFRSILV